MSDPTTPAKKRGRKGWLLGGIGLVLVLLLIGGAIALGFVQAGSKAQAYERDFRAWTAKDKKVLLAVTAKLPADTYILKGDVSEKKLLDRQTKGCDQVGVALAKVKDAGKVPTVGGSFLGGLRSSYQDAEKDSKRREAAVRKFRVAAEKALAQVRADCRWNVAYNTASGAGDPEWEKSKKMLDPPGQVAPGIRCNDEDGCIPHIDAEKNTYADLRITSIDKTLKARTALFAPGKCEKTSYGAKGCETYLANVTSYAKASRAAYVVIRKAASSIDNAEIRKAQDHTSSVSKKNDRTFQAFFHQEFAEITDKEVRESPGWTDKFFTVVGTGILKRLTSDRTALEKLS